MKIGGYKATTEIHLSPEELAILDNPKRVDVLIDNHSTKNWITLHNSISGGYAVNEIAQAVTNGRDHTHRITIGITKMHFGMFGLTSVPVYSPGKGTLIGTKPNTDTPIIHRRRESITRPTKRDPLDDVRAALEVVNTFLAETKGAEVSIEEGQIKLRLLLEF